MTYAEKLKDPRWQRKRLEILNRDNFTCLDCEASDKTLHVHHCLYQKGNEPWDAPDSELRTLCEDCHEERQAVEHDVKLEFQRLMAMMTTEQLSQVMRQILEAQAFEGPVNGLAVMCNDAYEWHADARWFRVAWNNPEFRSVYTEVTGNRPKWGAA